MSVPRRRRRQVLRRRRCSSLPLLLLLGTGISNNLAPCCAQESPIGRRWNDKYLRSSSLSSSLSSSSRRKLQHDVPPSLPEAEDFGGTKTTTTTTTTTAASLEPSHVRLCREFVRRSSSHADTQRRELGEAPSFVVEETSEVCYNNELPHESLSQIFAASLIANAGKDVGLTYHHNCGSRNNAQQSYFPSVQQMLPADLTVAPEFANVDSPNEDSESRDDAADAATTPPPPSNGWNAEILELCRICLSSSDNPNPEADQESGGGGGGGGSNSHVGPECILTPTLAEQDSRTGRNAQSFGVLERILPSIQSALYTAAAEWKRQSLLQDHNSLDSGGGGGGEEFDGAIVYLGCPLDRCYGTAVAMPLMEYVARIPPSVESISILTSIPCAEHVASCAAHGQALHQYLAALYPRAHVSYRTVASTAESYARLLLTKHLLGPPSLSWLFPALLRGTTGGGGNNNGEETLPPRHYKYTTLIDEPNLYPWMYGMKQALLPHLQLQEREQTPLRAIGGISPEELEGFLRHNPPPGSEVCIQLRGRWGSWQQDMEYAAFAQYQDPLYHFQNCNYTETNGMPYQSASTFQWVENVFRTCSIRLLTLEGLCQALEVKGIGNLMVIGDSIALQFAHGLWKLMRFPGEPNPVDGEEDYKPWSRNDWSQTITCPTPKNHKFQYTFIRNDLLNDNDQPVFYAKPGVGFNCGKTEYCFPWLKRYQEFQGRSLLVVNSGSHVHTNAEYRTVVDTFLHLMDHHLQPEDLVLFRTTVPGHNGCDRQDIRPYSEYAEYAATEIPDFKSWHKFGGYNDYLHRQVWARRQQRQLSSSASAGTQRIDVLDVFPMSVLRPDGHQGGPDLCNEWGRGDCLHYNLPGGPVDWWVHMMFSNLGDMGP